jgi:hypothetical protein
MQLLILHPAIQEVHRFQWISESLIPSWHPSHQALKQTLQTDTKRLAFVANLQLEQDALVVSMNLPSEHGRIPGEDSLPTPFSYIAVSPLLVLHKSSNSSSTTCSLLAPLLIAFLTTTPSPAVMFAKPGRIKDDVTQPELPEAMISVA